MAYAERRIHCGLKGCPSCARVEAARRVRVMTDATARLPEIIRERQPVIAADLDAQLAEDERLVAHHEAGLAAARRRFDEKYPDGWTFHGGSVGAEKERERWEKALNRLHDAEEEELPTGKAARAKHERRRAAAAAAANRAEELMCVGVLGRERSAARREAKKAKMRATVAGWQADFEKATARVAQGTRFAANARNSQSWSWKLITVSPPYDPLDPQNFCPEGLRRRADDVAARCADLWTHVLAAGGLAAATVSLECSDHGHIHAHILYFGPFVIASYAREVAGCIIDVRAVKPSGARDRVVSDDDFCAGETLRDAVVEAAKYAVKLPSRGRVEWWEGEGQRVTHPELVARLCVGWKRLQTVRHYGTMRDAVAAGEEAEALKTDEDDAVAEVRCAHCATVIDTSQPPAMLACAAFIAVHGRDAWKRVSVVRMKPK